MATRRPAGADLRPAGRRLLAGARVFFLVVVIAMAIITVAIPAQQLLDQHNRLNALEADLAASQKLYDSLQSQVARWQDPAYVEAQARDRLHYVMPGEVGYVVLEAEEAPAIARVVKPKSDAAWYRLVWQSMADAADTAAPSAKRAKQ